MKKILVILFASLSLLAFSQDKKEYGKDLFTVNVAYKTLNHDQANFGLQYTIAGKNLGLDLGANFTKSEDGKHLGIGIGGKVFFANNNYGRGVTGLGVDMLLTNGKQYIARYDLGYELIVNHFIFGIEGIVGYDFGYSYSSSGSKSSSFGGVIAGVELKIGVAF